MWSFVRGWSTLIAQQPWKIIPFRKTSKTLQDKLVDIGLDIPATQEILELSTVFSSEHLANFMGRIETALNALDEWRYVHSRNLHPIRPREQLSQVMNSLEWEHYNPGAVRIVSGGLLLNDLQDPNLVEVLSTTLSFQRFRQATEMIYYNTALFRLIQLRSLLLHAIRPQLLTNENLADIRSRFDRREVLMPNKAKFCIEPALEFLRIIPHFMRNLATCKEKDLMPIESLGVFFLLLRNSPECAVLRPVFDTIPYARYIQDELGYLLWKDEEKTNQG